MENVLVSWSGGKDSAMALHEIMKSRAYNISALLTVVTEGYERISMHGVRTVLLEKQASSLGIPLEKIYISKQSSNEEYESKMLELLARYKARGVSSVVFGDIFLDDLRSYREKNLALLNMHAIFPIWKRDTEELVRSFITSGFEAIVTCVDSEKLDHRFAGRLLDQQFVSELPASVNVCGENGEYHSFVFGGPVFRQKISFTRGEIVLRDNRFYFCDLLPE